MGKVEKILGFSLAITVGGAACSNGVVNPADTMAATATSTASVEPTSTPEICFRSAQIGRNKQLAVGEADLYGTTNWNVYEGPSLVGGDVRTLTNGTEVCLMGYRENNRGAWILISWDEGGKAQLGWVGDDELLDLNVSEGGPGWWEKIKLPEIVVTEDGEIIGTATPTPTP